MIINKLKEFFIGKMEKIFNVFVRYLEPANVHFSFLSNFPDALISKSRGLKGGIFLTLVIKKTLIEIFGNSPR